MDYTGFIGTHLSCFVVPELLQSSGPSCLWLAEWPAQNDLFKQKGRKAGEKKDFDCQAKALHLKNGIHI